MHRLRERWGDLAIEIIPFTIPIGTRRIYHCAADRSYVTAEIVLD